MNQVWAELNRTFQEQIRKESGYAEGIETLLRLRRSLMEEVHRLKQEVRPEDFCAMPFPKANGYHSKTIAYSIWHIFRIEDIVAHSLILEDSEIFPAYRDKIGASIQTTGNELVGEEISAFSGELDLDALYDYADAVRKSTDRLLLLLSFRDLRRKFGEKDKQRLRDLQVVSSDERACWLIDYWCGKDIGGLLRMPFSRHWIMHIEASLRIRNKLCQKEIQKGAISRREVCP